MTWPTWLRWLGWLLAALVLGVVMGIGRAFGYELARGWFG